MAEITLWGRLSSCNVQKAVCVPFDDLAGKLAF